MIVECSFLSLSFTVTEWSCLMVMFYEIAYVQHENTHPAPRYQEPFFSFSPISYSITHSFSLSLKSQDYRIVEPERTLETI